jgi:hypothetical protein
MQCKGSQFKDAVSPLPGPVQLCNHAMIIYMYGMQEEAYKLTHRMLPFCARDVNLAIDKIVSLRVRPRKGKGDVALAGYYVAVSVSVGKVRKNGG